MTRHTNTAPIAPGCGGRQRRGTRRHALHAEVEMLYPRDGHGVTINASDGGLRVAVDCVLELGEDCVLRVSGGGHEARIVHARVVWCDHRSDGSIAGLQLAALH